MQVAHYAAKTFVTGFVPFSNLPSQHANCVQDIETTTSCEVQDLHQNTSRMWGHGTSCVEVFRLEVLVVQAWRRRMAKHLGGGASQAEVTLDTLHGETLHVVTDSFYSGRRCVPCCTESLFGGSNRRCLWSRCVYTVDSIGGVGVLVVEELS